MKRFRRDGDCLDLLYPAVPCACPSTAAAAGTSHWEERLRPLCNALVWIFVGTFLQQKEAIISVLLLGRMMAPQQTMKFTLLCIALAGFFLPSCPKT
jgi:hypothetical protein